MSYSDNERLVLCLKQEIKLCAGYCSRDQLAYLVGYTRETLCRKINDPEKIRLSDLARIAEKLGKSLHFYFK